MHGVQIWKEQNNISNIENSHSLHRGFFEYFLLLNKTNDAFLYLSSVLFIRYIYKYKTQHAKAVLAYYIFFNWVINLDHLMYFSCNTINIYLLFSDFNFPYTIHDL